MNNTADYTVNATGIIINNGSYANTTITFSDGDRVWWYVGCTDNYTRTVVSSTPIRIIDVDEVYYILSLGANRVINFSLTTGDITSIGDIIATSLTVTENLTLSSPNGTVWDCGVGNTGTFACG